MGAKEFVDLAKTTFSEWREDRAPRLSAALAYYTIFSLAPLLVVVIAVAGLFLGQQAVEGQIVGQMRGLIGEEGARLIQTMIASASKPSTSIIASVIGIATLLLGARGVFGELQASLNTIWEVEPKPTSILDTIRQRFLSFTMVLGIGFLLLVSLVVSAGLAAATLWLSDILPIPAFLLHLANFLISFLIITLLFAMIYKFLPDVIIAWRDVWIGAAVSALLFSIGKFALGFYLGQSAPGSAYGVAGSLAVLLLWMYYSAMIMFLGAEFTQVYANRYGRKVKPKPDAVPVTAAVPAEQGRPEREGTPSEERSKERRVAATNAREPTPIGAASRERARPSTTPSGDGREAIDRQEADSRQETVGGHEPIGRPRPTFGHDRVVSAGDDRAVTEEARQIGPGYYAAAAFGLGAIVTVLVTTFLQRRD